jgi:acyl-CoA dehydrogenase
LAGYLKRKEMLSGRLADIHGHLFIATAILQFYQYGSKSKAERLHAEVALQHSLYTIQEAFLSLFANFPNRMAANLVSFVTFPSGRIFTPASDELKRQLGDTFMDDFEANPFRDYLKTMVYYNTDPDDVTGRMEHAYQTLLEIEPLWQSFKKAEHKGMFEGLTFEDHVVNASQNGDITEEEAEQLINYNALRFDSLLTDVFDEHLLQAQERFNPHSLENAVHKLTDYAQLKNEAQARNGTTPVKEAPAPTDHNETIANPDKVATTAAKIEVQTGDTNPDHGYQPDGDVKMVDEQSTVNEKVAQTDFADANPRAEAIDNRYRDAASILNERMSFNHSQNQDQAKDETPATTVRTENSAMSKNAINKTKFQDGLRREEDNKV